MLLESRAGCLVSFGVILAWKNLGFCSSGVGLLLIDEFLPLELSASSDCPYPDTCFFGSGLPTGGLDGILALTSFAYTNMGELSGLVILVADSLRSNTGGLDETDDPGPSLSTLDALDLRPEVEIFNPSPLEAHTSCGTVSLFSLVKLGLTLLGVPLAVPFGVDDALSSLAFLEPERGVTLELKKALTGVATSSCNCPLSAPDPSTRPSLRRVEDTLAVGGVAILVVPLRGATHLGD